MSRRVKEKEPEKKVQWQDMFYLRAYELSMMGWTDKQICADIGADPTTFKRWQEERPVLKAALERGRNKSKEKELGFAGYIYEQLPEHLKELWDRIDRCAHIEGGMLKAEALLEEGGKTARQHLFLYALVKSNFSQSKACRAVNVSKAMLDKWIETDPEFHELIQEIHWHKGNFFEEALVDKVKEGDAGSIIFANRTFNRDRGYGEKSTLELTGNVNHTHFNIDELDLPLETRLIILDAMKKKEELQHSQNPQQLMLKAKAEVRNG